MEPVDDAHQAVRPPGQVLCAITLPTGHQRLRVIPLGGGSIWEMLADSVRRIDAPNRSKP
ncbi:hypothetical protein [Embleya sp. AB8]|uniref:hypothetical protein n=1 Tax=Embleya sp. AB8 TaxID=3156304 RepID=UPI003C781F5A